MTMSYMPRARAREIGPLALLAVVALAAALGGCSFGLDSLSQDEAVQTTGSIARKAEPVLPDMLDAEDGRRAKGALAIALDPQGAGSPVNWDNPDSRHKGTVTPTSKPYVKASEICRDFESLIVLPEATRVTTGTACRLGAGQWEIRQAARAPRPAS